MADIRLSAVTKTYGSRAVLDKLDLFIRSGECFTIVGPSGCGKTVILRLIAGFETPTGGTVSIGDRIVADAKKAIPPEERRIGVVFQDYAVWPHKTVYDNVVYPLQIAKVAVDEAKRRADAAIEQVNLGGLAGRFPWQLSGGQQQRVALARALVSNPEVMLLDEPLTNLDANLREEMRFEIRELQKKTASTILYVTHDQEVALAISDRIAVMDSEGRIRQLGTPEEVYEKPVDEFVYTFLGVANFLPVVVKAGRAMVNGSLVELPAAVPAVCADGSYKLGCRPMDVLLSRIGARRLDARTVSAGTGSSDTARVPGRAADASAATGPGGASGGPDTPLAGKVVRMTLLGPIVDFLVEVAGVTLRAQMQTEEAVAKNLILPEGCECGVGFADLKWFGPNGEAVR
ncbi:MAG: ABC transporter ATP-binding protein [Rectinemataceae bacterium]|nr:ABC transporter ATP-binding protein [Rectinemataceae bacterium]